MPESLSKTVAKLILSLALSAGLTAASAPMVLAHAVVKPEFFDESKLIPDRAATVVLQFNVAIHVPFAQVFLLDAAGKEKRLDTRAGDAPNQLIVEVPALAPGSYAFRYRVLAADGHYTDNALRFQIRSRP